MQTTKYKPITNLRDYLESIFVQGKKDSGVMCFRGQGNCKWGVAPSVQRLNPDAEHNLLSELFSEVPEEFSSDRLMFDKLVRAQHYSLPTRLVDVSLNPLVALYFACKYKEQIEDDGCVFTYHFPEERVKFPDSDTVSLICNLSRLSGTEKNAIAQLNADCNKQVRDKSLTRKGHHEKLRKMHEIERLIHFVREEKPYFTNEVNPTDLFRYYLVHPRKNNKRVVAQSGLFIAAGLLKYTKIEGSVSVKKLIISAAAKNDILKELNQLNINEKSMFPEIEKVSTYLKEKWEQ